MRRATRMTSEIPESARFPEMVVRRDHVDGKMAAQATRRSRRMAGSASTGWGMRCSFRPKWMRARAFPWLSTGVQSKLSPLRN
jgi:hypothetical protein